jgi:NAD-dependent deacetylase
MTPELAELLAVLGAQDARVLVLTGAGVSAESGIPTFRGPEGYWTVGSRVYQPAELATWAVFSQDPALVWPWYLYRRHVCRQAQPNAAHMALRDLEKVLEDSFVLVTQNVDGLHLRAGNSQERTWEIHGNIDFMRCAEECGSGRVLVPELAVVERGSDFDPRWKSALSCPNCHAWMRPHVLWFDECYDEVRYRYQSAQRAVHTADLLVVAGTMGATSLPALMGRIALERGIPVVDINPAANPFSGIAERSPGGWIQAPATRGFAYLVDALLSRSRAS